MRQAWTALAAMTLLAWNGIAAATPASAAPSLPVVYSGALSVANATLHPDTAPAGSNDWSCHPSAAHPRPVILVHGTVENMTYSWYTLSPLLRNAGYCVFALNYGQEPGIHVGLPGASESPGAAPVADSARQLGAFVDKVLAATGASKVDIVGHSQGGMMPRYYLKFLGGADKVGTLIGLAPSNHGTTVDGLAKLPGVPELLGLGLGPSAQEQMTGSPLMRQLNAGGDTVPGVRYTVIESQDDEVVTPYQSAFLSGPDVTNIDLQQQCPLDSSDHLAISFDANALHDVLNALDPEHATSMECHVTAPANGG
jgi:triacylglycerol esterase/lipase EstA (alpha/beta hydrolase family)